MSVLVGSLQYFTLPDIFRLLAHNKQTGALKIDRESGDGIVYFRGGEIYFATSSLTREYLGQRLVGAKLVTQSQLLRLLDEQKRTGQRIGQLVVEKEIASQELLDTFIKEQIQDAIFNLLQWDRGTFTFEFGETSTQEVGLSVSVETLIMESSRRLEELEIIQRKVPTPDVIVRMSANPPEDVMEINIQPEEWRLLVLADGMRTVRDIALAAERSEFEASRIVYGLVTAGLLEVVGTAGAIEVSDETMPEEDFGPQDLTGGARKVEEVQELEIAEPEQEPEPVPAKRAQPPPASRQTARPQTQPAAAETPPAPPAATPSRPAARRPEPAPAPAREPKGADAGISKETLMRLIAGVKKL